jgi:Tfp pilus assembly protein PilX
MLALISGPGARRMDQGTAIVVAAIAFLGTFLGAGINALASDRVARRTIDGQLASAREEAARRRREERVSRFLELVDASLARYRRIGLHAAGEEAENAGNLVIEALGTTFNEEPRWMSTLGTAFYAEPLSSSPRSASVGTLLLDI